LNKPVSFNHFLNLAIERKGSKTAVNERLPNVPDSTSLESLPDDRYLSELTRGVFRAGFVWKIIDHKWPEFEEAFSGFVPLYWQQVPPERIEALAKDPRIVRNFQKIMTVPVNARMIVEVTESHGSFGQFLAQWPSSDQVGLLDYLKSNGARLGGNTAQYFLRRIGWDGFVLSKDVETVLRNYNILDAGTYSKKGMKQVQEVFNHWHKETGIPYSHLSRIVSLTLDAR